MLHERPKLPFMHTITGADDSLIPADTQSTHKMCGVDKLHGEGIIGAGVKIGIIDSGFDYLHPQRMFLSDCVIYTADSDLS